MSDRADRALVDGEAEHECSVCGAGYYSESAAEGCCAEGTVACLMDEQV